MFIAQYFVCLRGDKHVHRFYLAADESEPFVKDIHKATRFKDRAEAERCLAQLGANLGFAERLSEFSLHHVRYKQVAA